MNQYELIHKIAKKQSFMSNADVEVVVKKIVAYIIDALGRGERVEIRGFGNFSLHYRREIKGRNPRTGEKITIKSRHVVHFKTGIDLKNRVKESASFYTIKP